MTKFFRYILMFLPFCFFACEEEFIPDVTVEEPAIVVEGYIEAGEERLPPYLLLTRSQPFFSEINLGDLDNFFVHDALVSISDGSQTVNLEEICWEDLNEVQQLFLGALLEQSGINNFDSIPGNFCVYVDLDNTISGEIGKTYDLKIEVEDKVLTASTTIEEQVPLDSLRFIEPEGNVPDSLKELRVIFKDPPGVNNYYRYFTSINGTPFIPAFNSVADDALFDGQEFEFPLPKAEPRDSDAGPSSFGLYVVGDTARIKWATIDQGNFNFWNTLEFNAINQGPFASYTRVETNVTGGIGIWGAYSSHYYTIIVD